MNVFQRVASISQFGLAAALVMLPAIATGSPIPGLRMSLERAASQRLKAAVATGDVNALQSLWSTLSGTSGLPTGRAAGGDADFAGAMSSWGGAFAAGGGKGAKGSRISPSTLPGGVIGGADAAHSARVAPLTAGLLQANDNHAELANPKAIAALSATFPFGQFSSGDGDDEFAGGRGAGGSVPAWVLDNSGHARSGSERKGDWDDNSGQLKTGKIDKAGNDDKKSQTTGATITQVPEPNSMFLLGTGAAALLATARRRKNQ